MIISYHGVGMVKVQVGERVIGFNPIGESKEHKTTRFGADLALISWPQDVAWNGFENLSFGDRQPLLVNGPGEYEMGEIMVEGFPAVGPKGTINTIYAVTMDDTRLVHLGALAESVLSDEVKERLGVVDVLFVPVGLPDLPPAAAGRLGLSLSPKIIIPVVHTGASDPTLKTFLKEVGAAVTNGEDKLTIKKKDIAEKEGEVIILNPQ